MAKKKRKPPSGAGVSEAALAKLEKHYDQVAGLLHCSNAQDQEIRKQAMHQHDQVNTQIARLAAQLRGQLPEPDKELAEEYGRLLQLRSQLQGVIHKVHTPVSQRGPTPPL